MFIEPKHRWDLTTSEARALQEELASQVNTSVPLGPWETLAAADVSFDRGSPTLYAAVVVVERGTWEVKQRVGVAGPADFPYVPGLLSFRELPAVLEAFSRLEEPPDVILCDGQGIAHPRRLGIASHLGLWLGRPSVGCAKSLLTGSYEEPGPERGERSPLVHHGEVIGSVLRSRSRVKPLFVSPGHLCDLAGATELVMETTSGRLRLPTPARMAHAYVNEIRRSVAEGKPMP